jgi:hypothetical protein
MNNRSVRSAFPAAVLLVALTCVAFRCSSADDKPAPVNGDAPTSPVDGGKPVDGGVPATPAPEKTTPVTAAASESTPASPAPSADATAQKSEAPKSEAVTENKAVEKEKEIFRPHALFLEGQSIPEVAYALTQTFMTEEEFKSEVKKVKDRFADFEKDTHGDMSRFLNDRLVIIGLAASGGKVDRIQKGLIWLSMYKEFQQVPPPVVERFAKDNKASLLALFEDFNWDRISDYIKNRRWIKKNEEGESKKTASAE